MNISDESSDDDKKQSNKAKHFIEVEEIDENMQQGDAVPIICQVEEPNEDTDEASHSSDNENSESEDVEPDESNKACEGEISDEETVVEVNGKRKKNKDEGPVDKIISLVPVRRTGISYTPRNKAKLQLKRGDFIGIENNGRVLNATVINREKATGKFYNYFNLECDDGVTRNLGGERVKWRKLEGEDCNMVLIPSNRHRDQDCMDAMGVKLGKLQEFKT